MKFIWIALVWSMPLVAQESLDVTYLMRYNDNFFGGRSDRMHEGILKIRGDKSTSYFVAKEPYKSKGQFDNTITKDTTLVTYIDLRQQQVVFQDFNFWGTSLWVSDSLFPMKWEIDTVKRRIGDLECVKARTVFRGRNYIAWYSTQFPIPFGPWKMGGLPGLIVELEDDEQNMVVKLKNIINVANTGEINLPSATVDWATSVSKKKKALERILNARKADSDPNCISCQSESKISFASWEKF